MHMYSKLINQESKEYQVINQIAAKKAGWEVNDLEIGYNNKWYLAGYAPEPTSAEIAQAEINQLEATITPRNVRAALLGDEVAVAKITETEVQIAELRKQL